MAKTVRIIASPGLTSQRIRLYADQDGALVATSEVITAATGSPLNYQQTIVADAGEYFATIADSADADNVDHWGYVTITADDPATFDVRGVKAAELPALQSTALSVLEDTGTTLPAQIAGISSTVTVTDISAAALAKFVTTDTTETTAADGSVAKIAQGGAVDNSAQLTRIEEQTSLITAAKVNIIGAAIVGNAGDIYQGSDYKVANGTAYEVSFSDPGAALKTILQDDAQTASILFGSGLKNEDSVNDLVGTIDPDNITASANVTTIKVEFTQAATAAADRGLHEFHIKSVTTSSEFESVRIVGEFTLRRERADVV